MEKITIACIVGGSNQFLEVNISIYKWLWICKGWNVYAGWHGLAYILFELLINIISFETVDVFI